MDRLGPWLPAGCAAAIVLAAMVCLGSVALVAQQPAARAVLFQPIILQAGNFGLSLAISGNPGCPAEIVECWVPAQPDQYYLGVWFSVITHGQTGNSVRYKPLLKLRLR